MPIVEADIRYHLSVTTGPGLSTAQPDPNASLGEFISSTEMNLAAPANNLFDDVSGAENAAADVEYRCIFVRNSHATLTLQGAVLWLAAEQAGGAEHAIGLDPAGVVDEDLATAQAAEIATEGDAPAGVTFSAPTTKGAGLAIGDIGPGQCQAIWIRRTATDSSAVNDDGYDLRVEGDTAA